MDSDAAHDIIEEFCARCPDATEEEVIAALRPLVAKYDAAMAFEVRVERFGEFRPLPSGDVE